jgi:hypothetical protein
VSKKTKNKAPSGDDNKDKVVITKDTSSGSGELLEKDTSSGELPEGDTISGELPEGDTISGELPEEGLQLSDMVLMSARNALQNFVDHSVIPKVLQSVLKDADISTDEIMMGLKDININGLNIDDLQKRVCRIMEQLKKDLS